MAIKRCSESFTIWREGAPVAFIAGQMVDDKHPILKTHGHLFADPETVKRPAPAAVRATEQATADPGEARTLTPPVPSPAGNGDGQDGEPFDPGEHVAPEVIEYLKGADGEERARVLAVEAEGQKRKGVLGFTE
jgi:hypothetical protein